MGKVTRGTDKRKKNGWDGKRIVMSILALVMALLFLIPFVMDIVQYAHAVTQDDIDRLTRKQTALEEEQSELQGRLDGLAEEEHSAVRRCGLLSEKIEVLEDEIGTTQNMVDRYAVQIKTSKKKLKKAKKKEKKYYKKFCRRVRSMEENGSQSYWQILFDASDFSDLLDRVSFVSSVMAYDDSVLTNLERARAKVAKTTKTLQEKKAAREEALEDLRDQEKEVRNASEEAQDALREIRRNQDVYAEEMQVLDRSADALAGDILSARSEYAAEQKAAEEQAKAERRAAKKRAAAEKAAAEAAAKQRAAEEQKKAAKKAAKQAAKEAQEQAKKQAAAEEAAREAEKQAEAERRAEQERKAAEAEAKKTAAEAEAKRQAAEEAAQKAAEAAEREREQALEEEQEEKSEEESSSGSAGGSSVADYAMGFLGGEYVWGGSDLSTGVDCSGFVMCVYEHFGYSLPHSSGAQAGCGRGVSYSDAQPGDIICYDGHVGIYIGGGKMVNALGVKYGIVVNQVNTGRLVAVRRIV